MPELPEVENTRRYLIEAGLPSSSFQGANITWAKAVRTPPLEDFVLGLLGATVREVDRRGKYLLVRLSRDSEAGHRTHAVEAETLVLHLGMTGGLRVQASGQAPHPLVRHTFHLQGGRELRFIDGRKFGKLWLTPDPDQVLPSLGPDPLSGGFTVDALAGAIGRRNAPIKAMLLEQAIVAGMGNLYADESLYLSGVNPTRPRRPCPKPRLNDCETALSPRFPHLWLATTRRGKSNGPTLPWGWKPGPYPASPASGVPAAGPG